MAIKNIAVIPARGGSKRIPRKNIKTFNGRPMIGWSILAAIKSGLFDQVIVSTDDKEIAAISKEYGASVPFFRPPELSDDVTPTVPVIAHSIRHLNKEDFHPDYVCCIYPCAPFIQSADLIKAYKELVTKEVDFVYPVTEYSHPTPRAMRQLSTQKMEFVFPEFEMTRTQDLENTFHDAGQFYWGKASCWLLNGKMHTDGIGMVIPNWRVVDIDNEDDWLRSEIIFSALQNKLQ